MFDRLLVPPAWLEAHLGDPAPRVERSEAQRVRVVDCRFVLGRSGAGRARYLEGHIPSAAFLDVDTDLSGPGGRGRAGGRHPLPSAEAFAAAARRAGISAGTTVVAYDDGTGGAARLWWLLRHFGHDDVAVLDGGLAAWTGPLRAGAEEIAPGDFEVLGVAEDTVDADALRERPGALLLDARAPERYRGEHEPIDPVAGHIPGARNVPFTDPVPADVVSSDRELIAYCGSGITASALLLKLAEAGRPDAKLYPGSWSDWVARGLPVETAVRVPRER